MTTLEWKGGALHECGSIALEEVAFADWRTGVRPPGPAALALPNDVDVDEAAAALADVDAVILSFPDFKDGRAYTQARVLRERYGFGGRIIARGAVLCDQALFMIRAGFDLLEIGDGDADGFKQAVRTFSHFYQRGEDGADPVSRLRARRRAAA